MRDIDLIVANAAKNDFGVPMFSYADWQELKKEFPTEGEHHPGVDIILPAIHRYISSHKPPLPITRPTYDEMVSAFRNLQSLDTRQYVRQDFDPDKVVNKFSEKMDVSTLISTTHSHNRVSGYWHNENRYKCAHERAPSTYDVWTAEEMKNMRGMFLYLWREFKGEQSPIDEHKYRSMFRLAGYVATQFKPIVAKTVYDHYQARSVVDISCGWGDRLAGFYCSKAEEFLGCDPNGASYELYKEQCRAYEDLLDTPLFPVDFKFTDHGDWFECVGNKRVRIFNRPAEDIDWKIVADEKHDLMFTSPPYFGIEKYAEGQDDEDNQSWKRYDEYDVWRDEFFYPVMDSMKEVCDKVLINIVDPVVRGKRCHIHDDINTRYGIDDILGMRMSRRPITRNETEDRFIVDGKALDFIEPIYVIG
jgi:hypothetical protein